MVEQRIISVDIGSTCTKGALLALEAGRFRVLRRCDVPTPADLAEGFARVVNGLLERSSDAGLLTGGVPVRFSSSAKGGLRIVAVGLVPELTVKVARLAACSAGGKVVRAFAYGLTPEAVGEIEALTPDIVLLTGGTDGGNRERVMENVERLAASQLNATIVYAGNRELAGDVRRLLAAKPLRVTANVMPDMETMDLEPARAEIRQAFLETIVQGKGLADIVRAVGAPPKPTPLAVFELIETIAARRPAWRDFLVVDVGGATTDVYSHTEPFVGEAGTVLRGLREPLLKRTVEGDLGVRVSVTALVEAAGGGIREQLAATDGPDTTGFDAFIAKAAAHTELLPATPAEERYDDVLARVCVHEAVTRHAGILRSVWTPTGRIAVQHGKDLRRVRTIVGTGGCLSRRVLPRGALRFESAQDGEEVRLVPERFEYFADAAYLWPLLGNLAAEFPEAAVAAALESLEAA
jgi:uncharacterized protein (TIGR01319 family)